MRDKLYRIGNQIRFLSVHLRLSIHHIMTRAFILLARPENSAIILMLAGLIRHQRYRHNLNRLCRPRRPRLQVRDPGGDDGWVCPADAEDGGQGADLGHGRGSLCGSGGVVGHALRVPDAGAVSD